MKHRFRVFVINMVKSARTRWCTEMFAGALASLGAGMEYASDACLQLAWKEFLSTVYIGVNV